MPHRLLFKTQKNLFSATVPSSLSQLVDSVDYENESVLDYIPEREWRLLAALARKKEDEAERERLAEQFRALWERERVERDLVSSGHTQYFYLALHWENNVVVCDRQGMRADVERDRDRKEGQKKITN